MPLVTRFETPGALRDLPPGAAFYDRWHARLSAMLGIARSGPGGFGQFYNASRTDVTPVGERALVWMGFPRRLLITHRDDRRRAFELGDDRANTPSGTTTQIEYLEWRVERAGGKITKVTFTTETPEYWDELYAAAPDRVLELYRALVSPAVNEADLRLPGPGAARYNPRNVWNTANGIVHYIVSSPANTLDAAVDLARGSVDLLSGRPHARDNFELSAETGFASTSADPRVQIDVNALARQQPTGLAVTFADPIGVYMIDWDDTGWTRPNGRPVGDYWRVVRGAPGAALRLEYEVPAGEGFVVGDIRIGGRPVEFGGQLAEHITVKIGGLAGTPRP